MQHSEIPQWFITAVPIHFILMQTEPKITNLNKEYGRGNRVRKQVNYSDDLTDDQFLKLCIEENEDSENSSLIAVPKKRARRGRPLPTELLNSKSKS